MRRNFTSRKRAILAGLTVLFLADLALAVYSWQLASAPRMDSRQSTQRMLQLKLLQKSIAEAQKIKAEMPNTQKECENFEQSLLPASSGYSSVLSELGGIAKKSGVQLEATSFKPTAVAERGVTEEAIESTINGDYRSVMQFLNGLQRSANIYVIESLTLATEKSNQQNQKTSNAIKLGLHIKTYFRTAA